MINRRNFLKGVLGATGALLLNNKVNAKGLENILLNENKNNVFFTSNFDGNNLDFIEQGDASIKAVKYNEKIWPDNVYQKKLLFSMKNHSHAIAEMKEPMELTGKQYASVEFYAPQGISDHIVLGVLSDLNDLSPGYYAILAKDNWRFGEGYRLGIEKAYKDGNSLFAGVPVDFKDRVYRLHIVSSFDNEKVSSSTWIEEYDENIKLWLPKAMTSHIDTNSCEEETLTKKQEEYCPPILGNKAFFAAIWQDSDIYWDKFRVEW